GPGLGAISDTRQESVHVRFGNASRRRHYGRSGIECGAGDLERLEAGENLMAASKNRIVIIGAGHNGLVAAYYLARAGFSPLVLERREMIGGAVINEEIHAGFQCPTLAHSMGPL